MQAHTRAHTHTHTHAHSSSSQDTLLEEFYDVIVIMM